MFVIANLLMSIGTVADCCLSAYLIFVCLRVVFHWINPKNNPFVEMVYRLTDPVLRLVRRRMPFVKVKNLDFSPTVIFLFIIFIKAFVIQSIYDLANALR